ncbi:hypothetical protein AA0121_g11017 [Alternaria tenuissima]|uniref:Uncharacterized protein n=1 Tax=Alternaria tenuissima TaxID=119927 RepID=A0AB37W810_9PLEO|nr:hypothetical protein AA0115_g9014 [Alternaria tenuissima]RYO09207.1 hypothetical protein AA0121_g11017 [Alternaria tenuissima]RYO45806.1 hypothetical protein AA0116_g13003 [Alternaria tenuissima]
MADHAPPSSSAQGIFSRRPSFFGGKNKGHKQALSTLSPPTLNLSPELDTPPLDPDQYQFPPRVPTTPQRRRQASSSRHSIASSVTDLGSSLRRSRSASLRTNTSDGTAKTSSSHKRLPSATLALTYSPEKAPINNTTSNASRPALSISTFSRNKQKSSDNVKTDPVYYDKSPLSAVDKPKTPFANMAVPIPLRHPPSQKEILQANQQSNRTLAPAAPIPVPNGSNPNMVFQHIHELASKRISTLDYLRKAHEGRIYWFNTLLFSKTDLTRLPSFTTRNQARRATHYLLLGFSLPTILDLNANSPSDYLKALNALLIEFEQYQSIHPADGSTPSTLSRARLPQMFKRANMGMSMTMGSKGRRSSSANGDFPMLTPSNSFSGSETSGGGGGGVGGAFGGSGSGSNVDSFSSPPTADHDSLLPNESYTHLQTPSLPFDPDFFSTFATLCDVLIDCYTKILSMLSTPESVAVAGGGQPSLVGDLFNKADARVRKIILAGVVREFEDSCRAGLKSEVGGVGKVVLGGLM